MAEKGPNGIVMCQKLLRDTTKRWLWRTMITYLMSLIQWIAESGQRRIVKIKHYFEKQEAGSCGET